MHTEELLQLNDYATVQYRLGTLTTVRLYSAEIEKMERQMKAIAGRLRDDKISQDRHDAELLSISQDLESLYRTLYTHTGELPLPPLQKKRLGYTLLAS